MEEIRMIAALIALAKAHPYVTAALLLWFALSTGWKAQPKEKRDEWSKAYPRPLGVLRFFLEILPDLLGAGRVFVWQVIRGIASREPSLTSAPDSPIKGELRSDPHAGEGTFVQLGSDGAAPRETIAPDASGQQEVSR